MTLLLVTLVLSVINIIYSKQPNIIFIVSDDLGYDDLSYSASQQIRTPSIAKFRSEGRGLEWYYGQPSYVHCNQFCQ